LQTVINELIIKSSWNCQYVTGWHSLHLTVIWQVTWLFYDSSFLICYFINYFGETGVWTQGLPLEQHSQPFSFLIYEMGIRMVTIS
jgi:hypothetical protein